MVGAITQMFVKFRDFVTHVISSLVFKLGNFANFKALFSVVLMDFPYLSMKKKTSWKGLFMGLPILSILGR